MIQTHKNVEHISTKYTQNEHEKKPRHHQCKLNRNNKTAAIYIFLKINLTRLPNNKNKNTKKKTIESDVSMVKYTITGKKEANEREREEKNQDINMTKIWFASTWSELKRASGYGALNS